MTTENTADNAKKTFLILQLGDKKELFLEAKQDKNGDTYFKNGPLAAFLGTNKDGVNTGAISLSLSVSDGNGGYNNVDAGVLYTKQGPKDKFLSGYVGGVNVVPGTKEGVEFINVKPVTRDADGKTVGTLTVTANVRGPEAAKLLETMPEIKRPAKAAEAEAAEPEAAKPRPKM